MAYDDAGQMTEDERAAKAAKDAAAASPPPTGSEPQTNKAEEDRQRALAMTQANYAAQGGAIGVNPTAQELAGRSAAGLETAPTGEQVTGNVNTQQLAESHARLQQQGNAGGGGYTLAGVTQQALPSASDLPNPSPPQGNVVGGPAPLSTVGQRGQQGGPSLSPQLAQQQGQGVRQERQRQDQRPLVAQQPRGVRSAEAPVTAAGPRPQAQQSVPQAAPEAAVPTQGMQPVRETGKTATGTTAPKEYDYKTKPEGDWGVQDYSSARNEITSRIATATTPQQRSAMQNERARLGSAMLIKQGEEIAKKSPQNAMSFYDQKTKALQASLKANDEAFAIANDPTTTPEQKQAAQGKLIAKEEQQHARDAIAMMQTRQGEIAAKTQTPQMLAAESAAKAPDGMKAQSQLQDIKQREQMYGAMFKSPEKFAEFKGEIAAQAMQEKNVKDQTAFSATWERLVGKSEKGLEAPETIESAMQFLMAKDGEKLSHRASAGDETLTPAERLVAAKYDHVSQLKETMKDQEERFTSMMSKIKDGYRELDPLLTSFGLAKNSAGRQNALAKVAPKVATTIAKQRNDLEKELRETNAIIAKNKYLLETTYVLDPVKNAVEIEKSRATMVARQNMKTALETEIARHEVERKVLSDIGVSGEAPKQTSDESDSTVE